MKRSTGLKAIFLGVAAVDAYFAGSGDDRLRKARRLTKPLLMPALAAATITDPRAASSPILTTTVAAQVAGWGGDVMLLGHNTISFAIGAGSFGIGHGSYITGFRRMRRRGRKTSASPTAMATSALVMTIGPIIARGAATKEPILAPAVMGYMGLLTSMWSHAGNIAQAHSPRARWLTLGGATLFVISDTMLGIRKFVATQSPPALESGIMATYVLGQFLLAEGALAFDETGDERTG